MSAWDDVAVNGTPSFADFLLALTGGETLAQIPIGRLIALFAVALRVTAGTGPVTLTGLKAGATVGVIASYAGGDTSGSATFSLQVNGSTAIASRTLPSFLVSSSLSHDAESGAYSLSTGSAFGPSTLFAAFTAPADGDYVFSAIAPGAYQMLAFAVTGPATS